MMKNIFILFFIQMKITKIEDLNNIPEGITELDISDLGLTNLPNLAMGPKGPDAVKKDACVFCSLPQSLTKLNCQWNQLTSLDNLPQGLTILVCWDNELTSLENLPNGLTKLICSHNKLTSLDNLPQGLTALNCSYNQLTSLDIANCDKLEYLNCRDNNFPEEMQIILNNNKLSIQEKINKLIDGCLIPYDNSFILK